MNHLFILLCWRLRISRLALRVAWHCCWIHEYRLESPPCQQLLLRNTLLMRMVWEQCLGLFTVSLRAVLLPVCATDGTKLSLLLFKLWIKHWYWRHINRCDCLVSPPPTERWHHAVVTCFGHTEGSENGKKKSVSKAHLHPPLSRETGLQRAAGGSDATTPPTCVINRGCVRLWVTGTSLKATPLPKQLHHTP